MLKRQKWLNSGWLMGLSLLWAMPISAQNLTEFEKKVTEFTLDNGLHFIVIERHEAPVVSMVTYADVGSADEVKGITGLAHVFEHMAFKGTRTTGTPDIEKELGAMAKVDEAFEQLMDERHKGTQADTDRIAELEATFKEVRKMAQELGDSGEMERTIERVGGTGLNAFTQSDATVYFYNLPSNKLELWFSLESDRFLNPVLREFYVEKDVVMEERRLRTESSPFGRLIEETLTMAFKAHPYGEPTVGHMSDLETMTRAEGMAFFKKYYGASNLTIAIAGDVEPKQVAQWAETYFGRLPKRKKPAPVETVEPPQLGERRTTLIDKSQPILLMGYHVGNINAPDRPTLNVISDILSQGRTSRFYKRLVEREKSSLQVGGFPGFPGNKYPTLMIFFSIPTQGFSAADNEKSILEELDRLKTEPVSEEDLAKAKSRARANLVRQLANNAGLGIQFATSHVLTGNWRNVFRQLEDLDAVTADDIMQVAQTYFTGNNLSVGMIKTEEAPASADASME